MNNGYSNKKMNQILLSVKNSNSIEEIQVKENTDDIRHSPTLAIYKNLKALGEKIYIYDHNSQ